MFISMLLLFVYFFCICDCLVCVLFCFLFFYRCLLALLFSGFPEIYLSPNWFSRMEVNENVLSRSQGARQRWRRRLEECSLWWREIVNGWSSLAGTTRSFYFCLWMCKIWFSCKETIEYSKGIYDKYQLFQGSSQHLSQLQSVSGGFLFSSSCLPRSFAWSSLK